MLIRFSPLVSALSGRAADVVAATWKGRAYVRKWVIPFNPQTDEQTEVRDSFRACVTLWRSLGDYVKTFLDTYGVGYAMSGYNIFISKNRAAQQAETEIFPVPPNPRVSAVPDFAYDSEPVAGSCLLTWSDPEFGDFNRTLILHRDKAGVLFLSCDNGTPSATETITITDLTVGKTYQFFIALYNWKTKVYGTPAMVEHLQAT